MSCIDLDHIILSRQAPPGPLLSPPPPPLIHTLTPTPQRPLFTIPAPAATIATGGCPATRSKYAPTSTRPPTLTGCQLPTTPSAHAARWGPRLKGSSSFMLPMTSFSGGRSTTGVCLVATGGVALAVVVGVVLELLVLSSSGRPGCGGGAAAAAAAAGGGGVRAAPRGTWRLLAAAPMLAVSRCSAAATAAAAAAGEVVCWLTWSSSLRPPLVAIVGPPVVVVVAGVGPCGSWPVGCEGVGAGGGRARLCAATSRRRRPPLVGPPSVGAGEEPTTTITGVWPVAALLATLPLAGPGAITSTGGAGANPWSM